MGSIIGEVTEIQSPITVKELQIKLFSRSLRQSLSSLDSQTRRREEHLVQVEDL